MTDLKSAEIFVDARLGADLLWRDVRVPRFPAPVSALFLDRDGVIIEEKGYIADPRQVEMLSGVPTLIRAARQAGMAIIEVTNQAGIARGYFGWREFVSVEDRTRELLAAQNVSLDAAFACPFHPDGQPPYREAAHPWRKPNPGMLLEAAALLNLDLSRSILAGDKISDQQAAHAAGLAAGIHMLTGYGVKHQAAALAFHSQGFPVRIASGPAEAASLLGEMLRTADITSSEIPLLRNS